jgi:PKD repeat protein
MRTIIQTCLKLTICFFMITASQKTFAQLTPFTVTQNQCLDLHTDSLGVDTLVILSGPNNGTLGPTPTSWIYCPNNNYLGLDSVRAYICVNNWFVCDTIDIVFNVQPNCNNMAVAIIVDSVCGPSQVGLNPVITGGTPPFSYQWTPFNPSVTFCNPSIGTYCIVVTDANGCTASTCYQYQSNCNLLISVNPDTIRCALGFGYGIAASATGGSGPYTYQWTTGATTDYICVTSSGSYCVTVTDNMGCSETGCYQYQSNCNLSIFVTEDSVLCMGPLPGLNVFATGGTAPYAYNWSNGATSAMICNLPQNIYCVTVTDAVGCSATSCYSLFNNCNMATTIIPDTTILCFVGTAIQTVVNGGNAPYTYQWSSGETTDWICADGLTTLVYCVTVTDANGCTGTSCYNIQGNGSCGFTYTQGNPMIPDEITFVAFFDSTFNQSNIEWLFSNGISTTGHQTKVQFNPCGAYTALMMLKDSANNILCSYTENINVNCNSNYCQARFYAGQDSINPLTFHFTDYSVYNPVNYLWDFGDGNYSTLQNPSHTYATAGLYNVCLVISDTSGCSSTFCKQINAGNFTVQDMVAHLFHYTTVTPGFPLWAVLTYYNQGTSTMSGTVQYRYPAGTIFNSSIPAPASHNAAQRLLTYNYNNVYPNSSGFIQVDLDVSASLPLATVTYDTMWVYPINGDVTPANNVSAVQDICVGSWDPNDKAVSPKGIGETGDIPVNTSDISYFIRFQNTGSAVAHKVVIRDVISNNIDLTSIEVSDASHAHNTEIIGNELVVTFHNIMLPDSNSNEPESHGHIVVNAKLKPGLTEGTQVFNTAGIYFDFNAPVMTNTVVNTLKTITGIRNFNSFEFNLMPNPAEDIIAIEGKFQKNAAFEIMNELGQVFQSGALDAERTIIDISALHSGFYFVKVKSKNETGVARLLISK